jgi:hypothetical protein
MGAIVYHHTASDLGIRDDEYVSTDTYIMSNVNKIIDFGASSDDGVVQGTAVDACI